MMSKLHDVKNGFYLIELKKLILNENEVKKSFLFTFFMINILLLTWCQSYDNLTTYDEQTAWCEKWILSHWVEKADFERKWSEKIWDKIVITWIQYCYDWLANQEVSCEFNENGKLLWIKSSILEIMKPIIHEM